MPYTGFHGFFYFSMLHVGTVVQLPDSSEHRLSFTELRMHSQFDPCFMLAAMWYEFLWINS